MIASFQVPTSRQGQTGMGQGGFTAHQFTEAIGEPVTVALKSPIPLNEDLDVVAVETGWHLIARTDPDTVILEGQRWAPDYALTTPVTIDQAEEARARFSVAVNDHPAPHCLSCGLDEQSLEVQAGALGDGRWATPFRFKPWAVIDGKVDMSLVWMAMDCSCGWYISNSSPDARQAVTVQFAVTVHEPIEPETDYSLVAWNGDYLPDWDGRKRGAAAALFDANGNCVAQSRSFWVALT